ncbi:MAG: excinuclease ABC subunit UvrC [Clostridia bacterium]|jgi:excinuclease ABC subunit C|nr:excinuclease ABC subunit UvrC [Clostridia bacterium]MBT7122752.1 excinuclease ABC subunit UvrC [Clostridia bacterium]
MDEIREKLKTLPKTPGVYLMKNAAGAVIYVGKALSLKNRVSSYFGSGKKDAKTARLVGEIVDFDYILTSTEIEALMLESNMIKRYAPYFNIQLRDDKHYPYIRIDFNEKFPRVCVTRKVENDGAKYFGPYIAAHILHDLLDTVTKTFPVRMCKKDLSRKSRPCINYEMGRCLAPCAGKVSEYEYKRMVNEVADFLSGKYKGLEKQLKADMDLASENMEYEKAATLRDRINSMHRLFEKQKAGFPDLNDKDVFAVFESDDEAVVQAMFVRKGELNHTERFFIKCAGESKQNVLAHLIKQYYSTVSGIAKQIYVNVQPAEHDLIEKWLMQKRGSKVIIHVPEKGANRKLTDMALGNAKEALTRRLMRIKRDYDATIGALSELQQALGMQSEIDRMECYDISNTGGTDSVGSMVVFSGGKPNKKQYRRFKIKTVEGSDDFASMNEVLTRRLKRALSRSEGFSEFPSLIVVDGGKGQLSAAYDALASLGLEDLPLISLAKKEEEVFVVGSSEPIILEKDSNALKLLTRIRDEAHRFAITYHRGLRLNKVEDSVLLKIPHVGETRVKALLRQFDTIGDIAEASFDDIVSVPGLDVRSASAIVEYFETER